MTWGPFQVINKSLHLTPEDLMDVIGEIMRNCLQWRYYTIYDLANKRIGLALARQPVGQAGFSCVFNGPGWFQRNGCPGGTFTCQRGCSPSRIIVVRWGQKEIDRELKVETEAECGHWMIKTETKVLELNLQLHQGIDSGRFWLCSKDSFAPCRIATVWVTQLSLAGRMRDLCFGLLWHVWVSWTDARWCWQRFYFWTGTVHLQYQQYTTVYYSIIFPMTVSSNSWQKCPVFGSPFPAFAKGAFGDRGTVTLQLVRKGRKCLGGCVNLQLVFTCFCYIQGTHEWLELSWTAKKHGLKTISCWTLANTLSNPFVLDKAEIAWIPQKHNWVVLPCFGICIDHIWPYFQSRLLPSTSEVTT